MVLSVPKVVFVLVITTGFIVPLKIAKKLPVDFPSIDAVHFCLGTGVGQKVKEGFTHEVGASQDEDFLFLTCLQLHWSSTT